MASTFEHLHSAIELLRDANGVILRHQVEHPKWAKAMAHYIDNQVADLTAEFDFTDEELLLDIAEWERNHPNG